jgi:hypothetical protein
VNVIVLSCQGDGMVMACCIGGVGPSELVQVLVLCPTVLQLLNVPHVFPEAPLSKFVG